jgi:hypothetical protein
LITISTNISEVYREFDDILKKAADADKVLRTVAESGKVMIVDRVQQKGEKTDGSKLKTKSNKTLGAYSAYYGKTTRLPTHRVDQVDLTLTGDMFSDFVVEPTGQTEYSIGFRGDSSAAKAEYAEDYYGPIFTPSFEEEEFILESLNRKLDELFR